MNMRIARAAAPLAALALVIAPAACGGGDPASESTGKSESSVANPEDAPRPGQDAGRGGKADGKGGLGAPVSEIVERVPSGPPPERKPTPVPRTGDKSIQTFGTPAAQDDFQQIARTVQAFEIALANDDIATACALLATPIKESLVRVGEVAAEKSDGKVQAPAGCPQVLRVLARSDPAASEQARAIRVTDARIEGAKAFAIYRMPGTGLVAHAVAREDGAWKVASISGIPLN